MKYFTSHSISNFQINKILGNPIKQGVRGSAAFFIVNFSSSQDINLSFTDQTKCNFQLYEKGVLLYIFYSDKRYAIPVLFSSISKISLVKGAEYISPLLFSPFWIMLKLGVPIRYSHIFRLWVNARVNEYIIRDTSLHFITHDLEVHMISKGYHYYSQKDFFSLFPIGVNLEIVE